MGNLDHLTYRVEPVPPSVQKAAEVAAAQSGFDPAEEVLIEFEINSVRWVSEESVKAFYKEWLLPPCSYSTKEIVRIDWHTWAVPNRFTGGYEKDVIERSESVVVAIPTLLEIGLVTYGLGPEYNWLEWGEGSPASADMPASVFDMLGELITGEWREEIQEHAQEYPDYLELIHPRIRDAVAVVIDDVDVQK